MIEIKEGPELDRAVAEAIGWPKLRCAFVYYGDGGYEGALFRCSRCGDVVWDSIHSPDQACLPKYSTDLNAAWAAAEKVFLVFRLQCRGLNRYEFECEYPGDDGWSRCGEFSTGALAICAAILKLKENTK